MHLIFFLLQILAGLVGLAILAWLAVAVVLCVNAYDNKPGLQRPTHQYLNIFSIPWAWLLDKGVRVLVFDIDNTLCPTYTKLDQHTIELLHSLKAEGFEIWLASKSNPKLDEIEHRVRHCARVYRKEDHPEAKKPTVAFFNFFTQMISAEGTVAFIGDKLTDMGKMDMQDANRAYSILVKPISKDLRCENSFMLRRVRERLTMRGWGLKLHFNDDTRDFVQL